MGGCCNYLPNILVAMLRVPGDDAKLGRVAVAQESIVLPEHHVHQVFVVLPRPDQTAGCSFMSCLLATRHELLERRIKLIQPGPSGVLSCNGIGIHPKWRTPPASQVPQWAWPRVHLMQLGQSACPREAVVQLEPRQHLIRRLTTPTRTTTATTRTTTVTTTDTTTHH